MVNDRVGMPNCKFGTPGRISGSAEVVVQQCQTASLALPACISGSGRANIFVKRMLQNTIKNCSMSDMTEIAVIHRRGTNAGEMELRFLFSNVNSRGWRITRI